MLVSIIFYTMIIKAGRKISQFTFGPERHNTGRSRYEPNAAIVARIFPSKYFSFQFQEEDF